MKNFSKKILESGPALHSSAVMSENILKDCRVLGLISKNNRIYPKEVIAKSLQMYEGCPVNIDHPVKDGPRNYVDRFGKIINVRLSDEGVFGDLIFNPAHPLAESFKWWAENQPNAIGLSHNALAKTKINKDGTEQVTSLEKVLSVDIVSDPGSTNGLFEHYFSTLESVDMRKKKEDLVRKLDKGTELKMEEESKDKEKESSGMDESSDLRSKFMEVVGDEEKVNKLLSFLDAKEEAEKDKDEEKKPEADDAKNGEKKPESEDDGKEEKDDEDEEKKTEESFQHHNSPSIKKLLEELDAYRVKEQRELLSQKAKDSCAKAGIPQFGITDVFLNSLMEADESRWQTILEDRKKVCITSKTPISTGMVDSKASIQDLVKFLTQE